MNTKNRLTRAECQKKLLAENAFQLRLNFFLLAIFLTLLIFSTVACIRLFDRSWFLGIPLIIAFFVPSTIFTCKAIGNVRTLRLIERGGFSIVKDTVIGFAREPNRKHTEEVDVIYLSKHGRVLPSDTAFKFSSVGDEFYVVILHNKNGAVAGTYHTKMYTCDEMNEI